MAKKPGNFHCHAQSLCGKLAPQHASLTEESAMLRLANKTNGICAWLSHTEPATIQSPCSDLHAECCTSAAQHRSRDDALPADWLTNFVQRQVVSIASALLLNTCWRSDSRSVAPPCPAVPPGSQTFSR